MAVHEEKKILETPISVRHAMTDREIDFCKRFVAFGKRDATESYRRSHLLRRGNGWYEPDDNGKIPVEGVAEPWSPDYISRAAARLLEKQYIQQYIKELEMSASDGARNVLREQVLLGDDASARRAAEQILAQEDKLTFRDSALAWAEIMCAIGAEVVVPVPNHGEVVFPLREMFPRFKEALPPADAIRKTIDSLQAYAKKAKRQAEAPEADAEGTDTDDQGDV